MSEDKSELAARQAMRDLASARKRIPAVALWATLGISALIIGGAAIAGRSLYDVLIALGGAWLVVFLCLLDPFLLVMLLVDICRGSRGRTVIGRRPPKSHLLRAGIGGLLLVAVLVLAAHIMYVR